MSRVRRAKEEWNEEIDEQRKVGREKTSAMRTLAYQEYQKFCFSKADKSEATFL